MELRLFSRGVFVAYATHNPTTFNRGLLNLIHPFKGFYGFIMPHFVLESGETEY